MQESDLTLPAGWSAPESGWEHKGWNTERNIPGVGGDIQPNSDPMMPITRTISWAGAEGETEVVKMSDMTDLLLLWTGLETTFLEFYTFTNEMN